jgi:hypothetical protein
MSNLITEGFDWFPSGKGDAARANLWAANEFFTRRDSSFGFAEGDVVTGRFGFGKALTIWGSVWGFFINQQGYVVPVNATPAEGFMGLAVFVSSSLSALNRPTIGFFDAVTNYHQITISFEPNGVIKVWRGKRGETLLINSPAGAYQEDEWFHTESRAKIAGSGGEFELRINTETKIQLLSANTQYTGNSYFDSIFLGAQGVDNRISIPGPGYLAYDDLFVNDTTGLENNTWMGNLRVKSQFMIANGAVNNFTIGGSSPAATNWQSVLNNSLDDSKYVYDITPGDKDLYTPDPNLNAPLVRVLQVRLALRQDDSTQRSAKALVRLSTTTYEGSVEFFTNTTYTFYKQRWELSPATGVTFTGSEINGCQVGVKVQS